MLYGIRIFPLELLHIYYLILTISDDDDIYHVIEASNAFRVLHPRIIFKISYRIKCDFYGTVLPSWDPSLSRPVVLPFIVQVPYLYPGNVLNS